MTAIADTALIPGLSAADSQMVAHAAEHEHTHDTLGANKVGLWLFMLSETMLFLAFTAGRLYVANTERGEVNLGLGLVMTAVLLLSSWLGYGAVAAIGRGDRRGFMTRILLTIALGILFIGGVVFEWSTAPFARNSGYGTAFFAMTGLHVFHLFQGLLALTSVAIIGARGGFGPGDHWGVTGAVRFWTFVDVMWLVIVFPVLYLL